MPTSLELSLVVTEYSPLALFEAVYGGDGAFLRAYHKAANADPDARVGPWIDDERTVTFCMPLEMPAFMRRIVGKDAMSVTEVQRRRYLPDGAITLSSLPVPDMPGGAKFSTLAESLFTAAPAGGCLVRCQVVCSAAGPYGLSSAIESFMADSARKSLQQFLDAIPVFLNAPAAAAAAAAAAVAAAPALLPAAVGAVAAAAEAAAAAGEDSEQPEFFDAHDLPSLAALAEGGFEEAALLLLRYQASTGDQMAGLLRSLEARVRSLQASVAELQAAAAAQQQLQRQRRWLPELPETVSTRQACLGAALLASTAAAAALAYGRRSGPEQRG